MRSSSRFPSDGIWRPSFGSATVGPGGPIAGPKRTAKAPPYTKTTDMNRSSIRTRLPGLGTQRHTVPRTISTPNRPGNTFYRVRLGPRVVPGQGRLDQLVPPPQLRRSDRGSKRGRVGSMRGRPGRPRAPRRTRGFTTALQNTFPRGHTRGRQRPVPLRKRPLQQPARGRVGSGRGRVGSAPAATSAWVMGQTSGGRFGSAPAATSAWVMGQTSGVNRGRLLSPNGLIRIPAQGLPRPAAGW